ncbi:SDR family NAD(P)-dependent oxidoreductase [Miltoncostaea marina]|uniref:SDR family NAD(P)-dependent oxidoreductase n=1 Tax=Miltoncostaea marina TaxID=2843215 RepID=UPI001C3C7729|nr:SDR family oxidoreductase [Miltoncostaea marina]
MRIDLSGRTALVTGSTAGIGAAVALGLAGAGAAVVVNGRDQERAERVAGIIGGQHGVREDVRAVAGDVGTAEGCAAIVAAVPRVDILVNNAGVFRPTPVFEIPDEDWLRTFEVNVMAGVRLARAYVPGMVERGWGRVIFISSESAVQIPAEMVHYGMTKTAQLAVARGMAESVPASGVTINSVLPGPTLTEGFRAMFEEQGVTGDDEVERAGREFIREHRPTSLLGRLATPEEVANLVVYLASDQASATTGSALRVDGGVVRGIP